MAKKALVLSPFATIPLDAGQRKRAYQTTKLLKDLGFEITLFLYAFEDGWKTRANENWLRQMRKDWDEVIVWRANKNMGMPPQDGPLHGIDNWWDPSLEVELQQIFHYRFFDVFVVHNVWLSRAFDFAPSGTIKVLDSHDVFSNRREYFGRGKRAPEFFLPSDASEAHGANRADIVLAIQDEDRKWFASRTKAESICLPYETGFDETALDLRRDYRHPEKVVFGFLGSGNVFNVEGLNAYCRELKAVAGRTGAPVELQIGGAVCEVMDPRGPWKLCGRVASESAFFAGIDVAIAPVFDGSGFKVKVADATARGLPILSSRHAAIGMNLPTAMLAETPSELARMTADLAFRRPAYEALSAASREAYLDLLGRASRGAARFNRKISTWPCSVAYDLVGLNDREARAVLLCWSGAFHILRRHAKQYVIASRAIREAFEDIAPPGVFFISREDASSSARQIRRWVTVKNDLPGELRVNPERVCIQTAWRNALAGEDESNAEADLQSLQFWHYIAWGHIATKIVGEALKAENAAIPLAASVFVSSQDRSARLRRPLTGLVPDSTVVSIQSFEDFFTLVNCVAAGRLRRVVVVDNTLLVRAAILRNLCNIRGVEYFGPGGGGGLAFGAPPEEAMREGYQQVERYWLGMIIDDAAAPAVNGKNPVQEAVRPG